ncbi:MAG: cytochrome c biogenesis heme-transporting ATPase CcmA [Legionellales bacterium]|nr:cytochrome c biogenesis heme-transporting ATPase CcmA [Legionellales bacterium]
MNAFPMQDFNTVLPAQSPTLAVTHLQGERGEKRLFTNLNFVLHAGEILQIVGNNGAGKTTLLRMLCGLLLPTRGSIHWCGTSIHEQRIDYLTQLQYLGATPALQLQLTPRENLRFFAGLTAASISPDQALAHVGLAEQRDEICAHLSSGQQRRVALARLILNPTRLWILDEPLTALDQDGVTLIHTLIQEHQQRQGLIVITSHQALTLDALNVLRLTQ